MDKFELAAPIAGEMRVCVSRASAENSKANLLGQFLSKLHLMKKPVWKNVCKVGLCLNELYLIRRTFKGIYDQRPAALARWTETGWEYVSGIITESTHSRAGIEVLEDANE